jgi:hypothetical protein
MGSASFHSNLVTFKAEAIVVDAEDFGPGDHFVALDVLTDNRFTQPDERSACLFSFHIDRDVAEELVRQLQQALKKLPKATPPRPHRMRAHQI